MGICLAHMWRSAGSITGNMIEDLTKDQLLRTGVGVNFHGVVVDEPLPLQRPLSGRVIHTYRDPRDVVASLIEHVPSSYDLNVGDRRAFFEKNINSPNCLACAIVSFMDMTEACSQYPDVLLLKYEDLYRKEKLRLRMICDFLQVKYKEKIAEKYEFEKVRKEADKLTDKRVFRGGKYNLHPNHILSGESRWKKFAQYLNEDVFQIVKKLRPNANQWFRDFGYPEI